VNALARLEEDSSMRKLVKSVSLLCLCVAAPLSATTAFAEDKLEALAKSEDNWAMQGKNYSANHYSTLTQINADNVKNLKVSWSFSTGLLSGHEGAPLVVDGKMFIHTSFPNRSVSMILRQPVLEFKLGFLRVEMAG
jgi:methanol dehydrogenase (cytochrome c) subunit 1